MKDYKIAVIGDIHSNHVGLERCIEDALSRQVDEFLFVGDYISDCPYPQKTMDIIYDMKKNYPCTFIRGNREDYMLQHRKNPEERWIYSSCSGSLLYTYENLREKDFQFFEQLDIKGIYRKEGYPSFRYCHGSLTKSNELLLPDNPNMEKIMEQLDVDYLISGHTHIQESRMYGNKKLIHPGAVGIAWYHEGKAQYMIFHGNPQGWEEELFQLEFDVDKVAKEFKESGLFQKAGYWAKLSLHTLYTGEDNAVGCMKLAEKLCKDAGETAVWPDIPEKYWEQAAKQFNIL